MKHIIFLVVFCSATILNFAQKNTGKPELFGRSITTEDLRKHLFIVASAEMEGRETATPGQRKAAAYIEGQFRALGLEPGFQQSYQMPFPVYQDSLLNASLEVNGHPYQLDIHFNPLVGSNIDGTFRFNELTWIPSSTPMDSVRNMNLAGRLVLTNTNAPMGRSMGSLPGILMNKGVAAILYVQNNYPRKNVSRKANQTVSLFRRTISPQQYTISAEVALAILNGNMEQPFKNISSNITLHTSKASIQLESTNVIGVLPGTDLKDEYLYLTAHYDHLGKRGDSIIFYGADDDGSGTVAIIEIAEAFTRAKAAGKGPRRTIVFMAVSGEEKGLWGSAHYSEHPVFPLEQTTANLNIDMIGRSDTERKGDTLNYVYVVGDDKLSSDLRPISENVNKKYTKLALDYKFNDPKDPNRIYFRSDHYNFARKGVPIIFYYDGMLKGDYHRPTDTPDKINYPLLAKRAQLVFYTAWEMANRNEMLKRDLRLP